MPDWNTRLKEVMDQTEFMALSTCGPEDIWVCPVQFSYDTKLNLYFKSMPSSRHMEYICTNPEVAVAIFSTNRLPENDVAGLQIKGRAQILTDEAAVEIAARHHYGRKNPELDYRTRVAEHLGEKAEWNFVKIVPTEVWCFDTRYFDEKRQLVPLSQISLQ